MKKRSHLKGFTLIELLISFFIFSLLMIVVLYVFAQQTKNFRFSEEQQRNVENAQFAMNVMGKILRTSALADDVSDSEIMGYDFSQGSCVRFLFNQAPDPVTGESKGVLRMQTELASNPSPCDDVSYYSQAPEILTTGNVDGQFVATSTKRDDIDTAANEMEVGRVMILMTVGDVGENESYMQTSVSLRDYPVELSF